MDSPAHRDNILTPAWEEIGVRVVIADDGVLWVTKLFRVPARRLTPVPVPSSPGQGAAPQESSQPAPAPSRATNERDAAQRQAAQREAEQRQEATSARLEQNHHQIQEELRITQEKLRAALESGELDRAPDRGSASTGGDSRPGGTDEALRSTRPGADDIAPPGPPAPVRWVARVGVKTLARLGWFPS